MTRLCLFCVVLVGCLPTSEAVRNRDTVLKSYEVEAERSPPVLRLTVGAATDRLEFSAEQVVTCTREKKQQIQRYRETERTTNHALHGLVYAVGALAVLGGGALIFDAERSDTPEDRAVQVGDDLETGRTIGISTAAAGGLLLAVGIASSVAASDSSELVGTVDEPIAGSRTTAECDRGPAAGMEFALALAGQPRPIVPLGKTDAQGKLSVAWADVVAKLPPGARPDGDIVAGAVDVLRGDVAIGTPLTSLASVHGPAADPEAAWAVAVAANTPEAYQAYRDRFPASPHAAEALDRARAALARTALAKFEESLAAGNLDRAGEALAALRANSDPTTIASAQARLDAARKTTRLATAREKLPALLASLETAPDPAAAFAETKTAIEAIREVDAAEAARAQTQLDDARKRVIARLTRDGKDALAKRDYAKGVHAFDVATTISVDIAATTKAKAAAITSANRAALQHGRSLARERRFDDAIAVADLVLKYAPGDSNATAQRDAWIAARDKTARASADQAARDAARAEREAAAKQKIEDARAQAAADKAAREAAAKQKVEDARAQAAADKAAREAAAQQRIAEQRQREEAAKAQRAADREAKKRAAEEKRLADEAARAQRRADAAAKKSAAEQERLAQEAERARVRAEAEAKRAEEARQRADEAKRRADAAKAGIALEPPKPLPPVGGAPKPAPASTPPVSGPTNDSEARVHFQQGVALYGTGDYATALTEFEASYRQNPQPFVLKNIGLSQKALFRYAEAIATFEKFLASSKTFAAPDPQQTQQLIADMRALLADITVRVTPEGAQVSVDGRLAGTAPLPTVVQLATGTHTIEATADGHEPAKRDIMVSAGVPITVEMALKLIPTKGKVRITSTVARATVSIDGKPVGMTPLEIELDGGGHRLEVIAPKHKPHRAELVVTPGQSREVAVPLDVDIPPKQPWYMNKYVWAGAAAVVLGGIVIGVSASGTEGPIDGTLGTGSRGVP